MKNLIAKMSLAGLFTLVAVSSAWASRISTKFVVIEPAHLSEELRMEVTANCGLISEDANFIIGIHKDYQWIENSGSRPCDGTEQKVDVSLGVVSELHNAFFQVYRESLLSPRARNWRTDGFFHGHRKTTVRFYTRSGLSLPFTFEDWNHNDRYEDLDVLTWFIIVGQSQKVTP